jgi:hypothetical protein
MKKKKMKYSKIEILEFINSIHRQRIQIEIGFPSEYEITNDLTIRDWIDEMDLLNWKELCKYYCQVFEINEYETEFRKSMLPIKKKTIGDFCEFISAKSVKPKLEPVKLFGRDCEEAGIFKYLKRKMAEENESKSAEIKPSSKIENYMNDFAFKIVEEVNRINPNILPTIKYESNEFEKQNWKLFLSGLALLILAFIIKSWIIIGIGIGLISSGIWMNKISFQIKANQFEFEGIETFRDLVELIKRKKTACNT